MTVAALEKLIAQIRTAGGGDETVLKVITKQGNVRPIVGSHVWHSCGHPVILAG